jgi:hypothetical protein
MAFTVRGGLAMVITPLEFEKAGLANGISARTPVPVPAKAEVPMTSTPAVPIAVMTTADRAVLMVLE